ncbi:hypothetical protein BDQ12DRAFT_723088 [Crucibulum laeve]|uniref:Uncharacterized protein n=1 Tax=Crucibulum laeve TaxID=68775 RepID=A0A5C3M1Z0_9AGAR|nr:hypothetical protein BDQ12DRAFT_723088 [Crucibulum laeve]
MSQSNLVVYSPTTETSVPIDAPVSFPPPIPNLVYTSTASAIANFKPSPREIISGIAPHVFEDRRRRRRPSRTPRPYWYTKHANGTKSSPLRVSAVISWDDHSIFLEPSANDEAEDIVRRKSEDGRCSMPLRTSESPSPLDTPQEQVKPRRRTFRIDIPLLK